MSKLTQFLTANRFMLGYGFLLAFFSSFGQTFLISLYLPDFQQTFHLSDSGFSSIYAGATLLSAFTISWAGRFIDKWRLTKFTLVVFSGLLLFMGVLSQAYFIPLLFIGLYGLRLFGQGLLSHTAVTSMARFFDKGRGKAVSIANLGHPVGEAILPIMIVSIMAAVGWRQTLLISMGVVALAIPYCLFLLARRTNFTEKRKLIPESFTQKEQQQARPIEIIKSKAFWIIMPSSLAAAGIGTGFLLFKLKLGLGNGWTPAYIAGGFTAYAIGNAAANVFAGFLADRYTGRKVFVFYLLPAILGLSCLAISSQPWVYIALIGGIGLTNGFGGTVKNVAVAEMYGTKIMGSARSLFTTVMVFSTALGPLAFGFLLDSGYNFRDIALLSIIIYAAFTMNGLRAAFWRD